MWGYPYILVNTSSELHFKKLAHGTIRVLIGSIQNMVIIYRVHKIFIYKPTTGILHPVMYSGSNIEANK